MGLFTFKGGIHPYDGKDLSKEKTIKEYLPQGELAYPVSQHIGAPAVPVVAKGDHVLVGQLIAEAGGFVSANIHSSVSGTVKGIEPRLVVGGNKVNCIIVENDGQYESVDFAAKVKPLEEMTNEEIRAAIKDAGIVGMGGAGFPTHVKLSPKNEGDIDRIIVNCAECEPYLTSDYRRMLEEPEKLIGGLRVILKLFPKAQGILGVEDNKPDAAKKLEETIKSLGESRMEVKLLKTKYPQGAERQLIFATTGRSINSSMLPADAGCIVQNVDTVTSIYQAIYMGQPLITRICTVTGDAIKEPQNFLVRTGTCYAELAEAAGGFTQQPEKIISGGPMMGMALSTMNVPIGKTSSALLCFKKDDVAASETTACIKCGRCVDACPSRLIPSKMADYAEHGAIDIFAKYDGQECCECGSCSFVCPAKRQLAQAIKTMRKQVLANKKKK